MLSFSRVFAVGWAVKVLCILIYIETFSSVLSFSVCCRLGGEGPVYTSRHLALCCHSVFAVGWVAKVLCLHRDI